MEGFLWFGLAAAKAKRADIVFDDRLRKAIRFLAKISTPRDPRFGGRRCLPPIGNTYLFETTSQFGLLASAWRQRDPEFAETMQWMWQEHGRPENMCVGGDAGIHWHSHMLLDPSWEATRPLDLSSECFPKFGAVLRAGAPSDRETYLLYRIGPWLHHYDQDGGSIIVWGKGRVLSDDWGYAGHMPSWQHNRVLVGSSGKMSAQALQRSVDYVYGVQSSWGRQIMLLKDADPEGATWFYLRDHLAQGAKPSRWRYWLATPLPPRLDGDVVHQEGAGGVDCDIWLGGGRAGKLPQLTNAQWKKAKESAKGPPKTVMVGGVGLE
jgi:hypothetical protein